ncbi:MAG TPA: hypothetical protein VIY30_12415 [Burkholderiaceae bacterium]
MIENSGLLGRSALAMRAGDLQRLTRQQDPVLRPVLGIAQRDAGTSQIDIRRCRRPLELSERPLAQ